MAFNEKNEDKLKYDVNFSGLKNLRYSDDKNRMMRIKDLNDDGGCVILPSDSVERSNYLKEVMGQKGVCRLPVFKEMGNLIYTIVELLPIAPHASKPYFDSVILLANDILAKITLANEILSADAEKRADLISQCIALVQALNIHLVIISRLHQQGKGSHLLFNRKSLSQVVKRSEKVAKQLYGWRSYTLGLRKGHNDVV
jgi:hypothetical protein